MSDNWQAGDLALCVKRGAKSPFQIHHFYLVTEVITFGRCYPDLLALRLAGIDSGDGGWCASCFRKVKPHAPDAEDSETIRLLTGTPEPVA